MAITSFAQVEVRILELERLAEEQSASRIPVANLNASQKIEFYRALGVNPIINGYSVEKADKENGDYTIIENGDVFIGEGPIYPGERVVARATQDNPTTSEHAHLLQSLI